MHFYFSFSMYYTVDIASVLSILSLTILIPISFHRQRKAGRFYPTRLALNIASVRAGSVASVPAGGAGARGYIMVETNYRVYAYTQTNLQVALLGLFTELMYRCVWGMVFREYKCFTL